MIYKTFALFLLFLAPVVHAKVNIEHWQTSQGGEVYYIHTQSLPMADIQVVFDAGSARDGKQFGIAALTAALLENGAGKWNADAIAQRFESVGAQFSSSATIDYSTVKLRTLTDPKLFSSAIETLQTILSKPRFDAADFKREQSRTLAGLKQMEELPGAQADIAFNNALYAEHPYAHSTDGNLKTVAALTLMNIKDFYKRYYVAANAMVVIVGDLDKATAQTTAETLLKGLTAGEKPEALPEVAMPTTAKQQHIEFPSTQTHVLVGLPGSFRQDPDYFTLYVGNHILGGSGLVSKLFDEIREKRGLAYSASSHFAPLLKPGPFVISLQTRNEKTQEALQVLNQTLSDFIHNGPTEAELQASKQNLIGGFPMRFDTNKELAGYAAMIGFYHLPLDYLDTFTQKIEEVSVASIKEAFARRVPLDKLQSITVGNSSPSAKQ